MTSSRAAASLRAVKTIFSKSPASRTLDPALRDLAGQRENERPFAHPVGSDQDPGVALPPLQYLLDLSELGLPQVAVERDLELSGNLRQVDPQLTEDKRVRRLRGIALVRLRGAVRLCGAAGVASFRGGA